MPLDPIKTASRLAAVENAVLALHKIAERLDDTLNELPNMIEAGLEKGIKASVADEETMTTVWASAGAHVRKQAQIEVGKKIFGFVARGASWLLLFTVLASFMGWIPAWKVMMATKP